MIIPAVRPLPGVGLDTALRVLREQKSGVQNLLSGDAATRLDAFQAWAVQAAEQLEFVLPIDNVNRLVRTPRHDLLMGRATAYNESLVNRTISAEQAGQLKAFEVLIGEYEAANVACDAWEPTVLVPDTNVYLHQEAYFDEIGWRQMAAVSSGVLVLVPAAVLRELDSGKRANGQKTVSDTNRQLVAPVPG